MAQIHNQSEWNVQVKCLLGYCDYHEIATKLSNAEILKPDGTHKFFQAGVEHPSDWSPQAVNIFFNKYAYGDLESGERESSVTQVIERILKPLLEYGVESGYFGIDPIVADVESKIFKQELAHILLGQYASFNSPVWFNIGVEDEPQQSSACFILGLEDSMDSIKEWWTTEADIFKSGSGSGVNLSKLRGEGEPIRGGGTSSGPMYFNRVADSVAGAIRSGGKTRRAAQMRILDADHPDVLRFIACKTIEERKALALVEAGFSAGMDGEAYGTVAYQNANHTIRIPDELMEKYIADLPWSTHKITNDEIADSMTAKEFIKTIAEHSHATGEPNLQFSDTINAMNTVPNTGSINASNPCSEFLGLDNSACNLASINLVKFIAWDPETLTWNIDLPLLKHVVETLIYAQDMLVGYSDYPTDKIRENSLNLRPLGLGFTNLGAMLMTLGLPYDSDWARAAAGSISAFIAIHAYEASGILAKVMGPFAEWEKNRNAMINVLEKHSQASEKIWTGSMHKVRNEVKPFFNSLEHFILDRPWAKVFNIDPEVGFRNSQVMVVAPTGTISFIMDCDTFGIEPEYFLQKTKVLAGGGELSIINNSVEPALRTLGYNPDEIGDANEYLHEHGCLDGWSDFKAKWHSDVFLCAAKTHLGNYISIDGHLLMMRAVGYSVSGWISKTANVPEDTTVQEIENLIVKAWKLGLKGIAIYRDNSRGTQVYSKPVKVPVTILTTKRHHLPNTRLSLTHKFSINGLEGYMTVGIFPDSDSYPADMRGRPGEIFITITKEGSTVSGMVNAWATTLSLLLQYGVPLQKLVEKFKGHRFEPSGITCHPDIHFAQSIVDYVARYLEIQYLKPHEESMIEIAQELSGTTSDIPFGGHPDYVYATQDDGSVDKEIQYTGNTCNECGNMLVFNGNCWSCPSCGSGEGGCGS